MMVAAGPFSSKDNAEYEPLQALLDHCSQRPPDVLVLLGPFVDADHPHIQAGTLQDAFADLFAAKVRWVLECGCIFGCRPSTCASLHTARVLCRSLCCSGAVCSSLVLPFYCHLGMHNCMHVSSSALLVACIFCSSPNPCWHAYASVQPHNRSKQFCTSLLEHCMRCIRLLCLCLSFMDI